MKDKMKKIIAGLAIGLTICGGSLAMTACTEPKDPPTTETGSGNNNTNTGTNTGSGNNNSGNNNQNTGTVTEAMVRNHPVAPATDFEYEQVTGGIKITKYIGTDTIVNIPDAIDGKPVVELRTYIFANKSLVQGVKIPNTVKVLEQTFVNNKSIQVVICEGVEDLLDYAFGACTSLSLLLLGENLKIMGSCCIHVCENLESLYIPSSLTDIDDNVAGRVFRGCSNLTVQGESGSYIESYCQQHNIPFEVVSPR